MRIRRSVTLAPIVMPSRSLKLASDRVARVTSGFWPEIRVMSSTAPSIFFRSWVASPTPMFRTIFSRRGIWFGFL